MTDVVAIVQARTGSTRLPNKVLAEISGKPMLSRVVERLASAARVDRVMVATTTHERDDSIERFIAQHHVDVALFRGSEDDVLARYVGAAELADAGVVVRITADCPLIDAGVVDRCVGRFVDADGALDYVSNTVDRTYPRGLDVEVFGRDALLTAARDAVDQPEREHVTPHIWRRPEKFAIAQITGDVDRSGWRLTVDTPDDLELIRRIYSAYLGDGDGNDANRGPLDYAAICAIIDAHPEWLAINQHVPQKKV